MSICSQGNGNCGRSRSTVIFPQNSLSSSFVCDLPCVSEFSTTISQHRNQITRDVMVSLAKRCEFGPVLPPGTLVVLSNTTLYDQDPVVNVIFDYAATSIISVNITLQNVRFEIIGFASAIVRISGEAVVTVTYIGVDDQTHTQTVITPFVFTEVIPGDFPPNSVVQGSLAIINQLVVNEIDPSTLTITAVSVQLFFAVNIQILAPIS